MGPGGRTFEPSSRHRGRGETGRHAELRSQRFEHAGPSPAVRTSDLWPSARERGEIGNRTGLKNRRAKALEGPSPSAPTGAAAPTGNRARRLTKRRRSKAAAPMLTSCWASAWRHGKRVVAQKAARLVRGEEVRGSSPRNPTTQASVLRSGTTHAHEQGVAVSGEEVPIGTRWSPTSLVGDRRLPGAAARSRACSEFTLPFPRWCNRQHARFWPLRLQVRTLAGERNRGTAVTDPNSGFRIPEFGIRTCRTPRPFSSIGRAPPRQGGGSRIETGNGRWEWRWAYGPTLIGWHQPPVGVCPAPAHHSLPVPVA